MKKKIVLRTTMVLFAVLVVLTFTSRTIYGMTLPVVYTIDPMYDTVPMTARTKGILNSMVSIDILAKQDWFVSDVYVSNGDFVKSGDILFTIDIGEFEEYEKQLENQIIDLEIRVKAKELDILRLDNRIRAIPASSIRNSNATRRYLAELIVEQELLQMQLEQTQSQLVQARLELDSFSFPSGGYIYAIEDGVIFNLAIVAGNRYMIGEKLLSILPEGAPISIHFQLDSVAGKDFGVDVPVSVTFFTLIESQPHEQKQNSTVSSARLSDDGRHWEYKAVIDVYDGTPLMGIEANVVMGHSGMLYNMVVPLSSVSEGRNGPRIFVVRNRQGLFGEEFYVSEVNVTVLAQNNHVAAIDVLGWQSNVVTYTSRPIIDGDVVRVE
ncbi:MAG: biotin/lipoyl-binding protein [Oscillospiraceae bacterium]|jgi:multidrug efflux pump subunit AcrA (membrane-fusion protein)|nr:biotin/lipoyl-binding protein [Oscillospiraceae bacterium]